MKKLILSLSALFIALGLPFAGHLSAQSTPDLNNFTIEDYNIDYYLDRSADGRSTLKTVEEISALFPDYDQNHGIERAIPDSYDGHSTGLKIESVTDENGKDLNYSTYLSGGNTVVRIGNANYYVHGLTTFKLTYSQRDVTKYFSDTGRDEFYWDTNGTDWRVSTRSLNVRLHLPDSLVSTISGNDACYFGAVGSTETCALTKDSDGYSVGALNVYPSENITIAVGFTAKTFSPYKMSTTDVIIFGVVMLSLLTIPIGFVLLIYLIVRYYKRSNRSSEIGAVPPEYIPPKDISVSTAASIVNRAQNSFSAQLIDLAVRKYIRIYETREKSFLRPANYELEIIQDINGLKLEEKELLDDIFDTTEVGSKLDMSTMRRNYSLAARLQDNSTKLKKSITGAYALRARDEKQSHWFKRAGFITLIFSLLTFSPLLFAAAITSFICGAALKPLTDKGLELAQYLKGLERYIKVAETERLQMLQSPEGATKIGKPVDGNDKRQMIELYEKVLPYAILFGNEKEWNKRLGDYYQTINQSPDWYSGHNGIFNAVAFSSAISNFNSAATYSNPSSSSSGGSGGGGSSGGGGGGGGGGGW